MRMVFRLKKFHHGMAIWMILVTFLYLFLFVVLPISLYTVSKQRENFWMVEGSEIGIGILLVPILAVAVAVGLVSYRIYYRGKPP